MRKDEVLAELLQRLSSMGIEPLGTLEKIPSLVEQRTWISSPPISQGSTQEGDSIASEVEAAVKEANGATQDLFSGVPAQAAVDIASNRAAK